MPSNGVILEIDPTSEDAANVPLVLVDNSTYFLLGEDWPSPEVDQQSASSVSTEGEVPFTSRHRNTTGTVSLRVIGSTASTLQTSLNYIDKKLAKIMREGGTLKRTTPAGSTYVTDLVAGSALFAFSRRYTASNICEVSVTFPRRPYWRGAAVTLGSHSETTLPCLRFTETSITGDVPALGRLVVTEAQAQDQFWLTYGLRSRYYSSSADAALFYEAESRTPLGGGAATAVGPSGASGGGSNTILANSLTNSYQAILSTQASGGGNHLAHVGDFQVYARVQAPAANAGNVTVALEWAVGDFLKVTRNTAVSLANTSGTWRLVNLGQVSIPKVAQGAQRWEGRIIALSTFITDDIYVDHLVLVPITEGSGIAKGTIAPATPSSFSGRDEFTGAGGALNARVAPAGGTWATSGLATDFTASGDTETRATISEAGGSIPGRFAVLGSTNFTNTLVGVDASFSAASNGGCELGALARFVDASNHFVATISYDPSGSALRARITVAASIVQSFSAAFTPKAGTTYSLRVFIDAGGRFGVWVLAAGQTMGQPLLTGQHSALATGGALATGKPGFTDWHGGSTANTRTYDNFWIAAAVPDAAIFASRQLEIRNDRVIRQDSGGTIWATPSSFQGDYLLIPPSGREGRTTEIIVKDCRNDPATMPDTTIDDITAQLVYVPRFLTLPE